MGTLQELTEAVKLIAAVCAVATAVTAALAAYVGLRLKAGLSRLETRLARQMAHHATREDMRICREECNEAHRQLFIQIKGAQPQS